MAHWTQKLSSALEAIQDLTKRVEALEEKASIPVLAETPKVVELAQDTAASVTAQPTLAPVPLEYRLLVDNTLNRAFGVEIIPRSDAPLFEFAILVPDKYSTMTPAYKEMYKTDRRPKVMGYADGANGVRDWCEKVFNNFNPDMRALIVADRVNAQ